MPVTRLQKETMHVCGGAMVLVALLGATAIFAQQPRSPLDAVTTFYCHTQDTVAMALSKDGRTVAVGGALDKIQLWSVPEGKRLTSVPVDARMVIKLSYSPDGQYLAASVLPTKREQPNQIVIFSAQSLQPVLRFPLPDQVAYALAWSPDSALLAAACELRKQYVGVVRLIDPKSRSESGALTCEGRFAIPKHIEFSPDGATMAVGSNTGYCDLWDAKERKLLWSTKAHSSAVCGLSFSPDGDQVATISDGHLEVQLWERASGKKAGELVTRGKLTGVAFSPTGKTIAVASHVDGQQLVLWNAATHKPQATLSLGNGAPLADQVTFTKQGTWLVAEGRNTIFNWNVARLEDPQVARQLRLAQFPSLKALSGKVQANPSATEFALIWDFGAQHDEELNLVTELKKLRKLTVSCYSAKEANWVESDIFQQLDQLPDLEELVLQNVVLNSLRGPSRLSRLKRLTFEGDCRITSWRGLGPFTQLEELDLRGSGIRDDDLENLAHLKSLKRIRLAGTVDRASGRRDYLTSQALVSVASLTGLEMLELNGDLIKAEAGKHLAPLVNLRELKISGTSINDGCAEAIAGMSKLVIAQLPSISDATLLALAKLPNLQKLTAHGREFSDFALEQIGRSERLEELQLYGYWTPYDALKYSRDLKSMRGDELRTYDLMRCLYIEREYLSQVRAAQRNTALTAPFTPAAIPKFTGPAVGGDNPIHPRYDEHVASKQAILKTYLKLDEAKLDSAQRLQTLGEEALQAADQAFAGRPVLRWQLQTRIRSMAGLK